MAISINEQLNLQKKQPLDIRQTTLANVSGLSTFEYFTYSYDGMEVTVLNDGHPLKFSIDSNGASRVGKNHWTIASTIVTDTYQELVDFSNDIVGLLTRGANISKAFKVGQKAIVLSDETRDGKWAEYIASEIVDGVPTWEYNHADPQKFAVVANSADTSIELYYDNVKIGESAGLEDILSQWQYDQFITSGTVVTEGNDTFIEFYYNDDSLSPIRVDITSIAGQGAIPVPGAQGPVGETGAQGPQGLEGVQGPTGEKGEDGADGAQGPQGEAGINGEDGAQGPQGEKGEDGVQGPKGEDGAAGADGAQGPAGENGQNGEDGAQGPQGAEGAQGAAGENGINGEDGAQGPQGVEGAQGAAGENGTDGEQGPQGDKGEDGWVGKSAYDLYLDSVAEKGNFLIVDHRNFAEARYNELNDYYTLNPVEAEQDGDTWPPFDPTQFPWLVVNHNFDGATYIRVLYKNGERFVWKPSAKIWGTDVDRTYGIISVPAEGDLNLPEYTETIDGTDVLTKSTDFEVQLISEADYMTKEEWLESLKGTDGTDGAQGAEGAQGAVGEQGPQGEAGIDGSQGPQGEKGEDGAEGAQGPQGDTGAQGPQGDEGVQGPQGLEGAQGAKGEDGKGVSILGSYNTVEDLYDEHPTGNIGDAYLVGGNLYVWDNLNSDWKNVGNIKGADGAQGPQGEAGSQGAVGETGAQGPQGIEGAQGAVGETGEQGPQGLEGAQGASGENGEQGPQGEAGANGEDGAQGPQGDEGVQGPQGEVGTNGEDGAQGPQGEKGEDGAQGPQGEVGAQGETGAQGPQGDKGTDGDQGPQGEAGINGEDGAQGPQGEAGTDGEQGPQGEAGAQGAVGDQGPQGEKGDDGTQGPQGEAGINGEDGAQGPQGLEGAQGETGEQGPQGEKGEDGAQGPQGEAGTNGEDGAQGPQGVEGSQGAVGDQGPQGETGAQGPQGDEGVQGPQGDEGTQGPQGEQGNEGSQGPQGVEGAQGVDGSQGPQGLAGTYTQGEGIIIENDEISLDKEKVKSITLSALTESLIPEDAQEALDTLEEIAAWIQEHPEDAAAMNRDIAAVSGSLETLEETVNNLNLGDENVIEDVKLNGTSLEVVEKSVNIDLSGYTTSAALETALSEYATSADTVAAINQASQSSVLGNSIIVAGGPLADDCDTWPTDAGWTDESGNKVIPAGTSIEEVLVKLFSKVTWPTPTATYAWNVSSKNPTLNLSQTAGGSNISSNQTVEAGTIYYFNGATANTSNYNYNVTTTGYSNGYKKGVDGAYTSGTYSKSYIAEKSGDYTLAVPTVNGFKSDTAGMTNVSITGTSVNENFPANADAMYANDGANSIVVRQTGMTYTPAENFEECTIYAASNVKTFSEDCKVEITDSFYDGKSTTPTGSTTSRTVTGYRKYFYGLLDTAVATGSIDATLIRSLTGSTAAATGTQWDFPITAGKAQCVIAVPSTAFTNIEIFQVSVNANIEDVFDTTTVMVPGANGYKPIEYKVWTFTPASPYPSSDTYKIKFKN